MKKVTKIGRKLAIGDIVVNGYGERKEIYALERTPRGNVIVRYRSLSQPLTSFWLLRPAGTYTVEIQ